MPRGTARSAPGAGQAAPPDGLQGHAAARHAAVRGSKPHQGVHGATPKPHRDGGSGHHHRCTGKMAPQEGLQFVLTTMEVSGQNVYGISRTMGVVTQSKMAEGDWFPGGALLRTQMMLSEDDQQPLKTLVSFNRSPRIPLLMKYEQPSTRSTTNAPGRRDCKRRWKRRRASIGKRRPKGWRSCKSAGPSRCSGRAWPRCRRLAWRSRGNDRGTAAIHGPGRVRWTTPWETETLAMLLSPDPLGNAVETVKLTLAVRDAERLREALANRGQCKYRSIRRRWPLRSFTTAICFFLDRARRAKQRRADVGNDAESPRSGVALRPASGSRGPAGSDGRVADANRGRHCLPSRTGCRRRQFAAAAGGDGQDAAQPQCWCRARSGIRRTTATRHTLRTLPSRIRAAFYWSSGRPLRWAYLAASRPQGIAEPANRIKLLAAIMLLDTSV